VINKDAFAADDLGQGAGADTAPHWSCSLSSEIDSVLSFEAVKTSRPRTGVDGRKQPVMTSLDFHAPLFG
jgi:hypothetical protein